MLAVNRVDRLHQAATRQVVAEYRGVSVPHATIGRAWVYANPDAVKQAIDDKKPSARRSRHRHLPAKGNAQIKSMLAEGHHPA